MSSWRKVGAVSMGLIGVWLLSTPLLTIIERVKERSPGRKMEFDEHLLLFAFIWVVILLIGSALLFGAWKLWKGDANSG